MTRASLFSTLAFIALAGVFAPLVAPLVDHHSAERMPYHGHLQTLPAPHDHGLAISHHHQGATSAIPTVTVLPDRDGQQLQPASHGGGDLLVRFISQLGGEAASSRFPLAEPRIPSDPLERPPKVPPRA